MNKIFFNLPAAFNGKNLITSLRLLEEMPAPATGAARYLATKIIKIGNKTVGEIDLAYGSQKETNCEFNYSYVFIEEAGVVTHSGGWYVGSARDFKCGDIGNFRIAEVTDEVDNFSSIRKDIDQLIG